MPSLSLVGPRPVLRAGPTQNTQSTLRQFLASPSVFLFVILTAQLMVVLDTTIVNVALPHIETGLHFSGSGLSWVINGYLLTFGGLLLLGARSGDLLGRRRTFLLGIAIFTASSFLGGVAVTSWMLLASRALQGVGAAMAAPSSLALLTTVFSEGRERVRAIGLFTTVSAAGGAIGLVMGGVLTELASWRWVMFVNVPIGVVVFLAGRLVLSETPRRRGHFDLAGAFSSTLGMTGLVLGLVEAGSKGWGAPITLGSIFGGILALGLFVRIEMTAEEPILPLRLFKSATRTTANISRGLVYAGMYGLFFFLGQFLQDVQGYSPLRAGAAFLPMPISVFLSSQLSTRVLMNRLPAKIVMMGGISLATVALALASQLHGAVSYPEVLGLLVLSGFGSGTSLVTMTSASLAGVEQSDAGAASGLVNVFQQVGAALGLAVLVTVFGAATGHAQFGPSVAHATLVHGLDVAFGVGALFSLVAFVLVAFLVRVPPRGAEATEPVLLDTGGGELVDGEGFEWLEPEIA